MKKKSLYIIIIAALLNACSDTLYENSSGTVAAEQADSIAFSLSVTEQADIVYQYGATRSAATDSTLIAANRFTARTLDGDNTYGLQLHRMPLPMVGIHPHTVSSQPHDVSESTRALASDIVKSTTEDPRYETFHDSLTIWGYTSTAYTTVNQTTTTEIFSQNVLKKVRGWRTSAHWPYGGGQMKFYAVAPAMEALDLKVTNTPGFSTAPTFTYIVPDNPDEQRDLLYGESDIITNVDSRPRTIGEDDKIVGLNFQHILTAVRFAQGKIPTNVRIKSITLYHILNKGTYSPADDEWTVDESGTKETYTITTDQKGIVENNYIDNGQVFFMIPHLLTSAAELQITLEEELKFKTDEAGRYLRDGDGNRIPVDESAPVKVKAHTLKASLDGDNWKKGYTVTYKITIGEMEDGYYLVVQSPQALEHNTASSSPGSFTVHSYRNYIDYSTGSPVESDAIKNSHPVNWKVAGYSLTEQDADGTFTDSKPEWLTWTTSFTNEGNSTTGGYNLTAQYSINQQSPAVSGNHQTVLSTNSTPTQKINLANTTPNGDSFSRTPSNCYIVNRQGTFGFPLAYPSKEGSFVDFSGTTITAQWLVKQMSGDAYKQTIYYDGSNAVVPESSALTKKEYSYDFSSSASCFRAALLWQDVQSLIFSVSLDLSIFGYGLNDTSTSDQAGMIEFTINKKDGSNNNDLQPGNAVIVLYGKRKILTYKRDAVADAWASPSVTYEDNEKVIWTWHIWVTDEVYKNDTDNDKYLVTNSDGSHIVTLIQSDGTTTNKILPVNIGWVPDEMEYSYYKPREVWVKLEQTSPTKEGTTKQSAVVKIMQHARQPLVTGTSTIYQWGRPTAFPMLKDASRKIYNISNQEIQGDFKIKYFSQIQDAFLYPEGVGRINTEGRNNSWWDFSSGDKGFWNPTAKTTYDPSPVGFHVPASTVFGAISKDSKGQNLNMWEEVVNTANDIQKDGESSKGGYFYATYGTANAAAYRYTIDKVYIPATGRWSNNVSENTLLSGRLESGTSDDGRYWLSDAPNSHQVYHLRIKPNKNDTGAIELTKPTDYGRLMPIRPTGDLPATTSTP